MPVDFSMTNRRVSHCRVVGTGHFVWTKRCRGGMWGLSLVEGVGGSRITPTPFRFMVKTEGLLEENTTPSLWACQSKCLTEQPHIPHLFCVSLSV